MHRRESFRWCRWAVLLTVLPALLGRACLFRPSTTYPGSHFNRGLNAVLFGIPTSEEQNFTHRPAAENMASGLRGTLDGLNDLAAVPSAVTGVAIYPEWETDAAEWRLYEELWLDVSSYAGTLGFRSLAGVRAR